MKDLVSKFLESSLDDFKGVAVVVNSKPLHVLAENDLRLVIITYSHDILEQGTTAASFIIVLEAAMLSCHRERLTGKSCQTDVEGRNFAFFDLRDIAGNLEFIVKVRTVCLLCGDIPLADEHRI